MWEPSPTPVCCRIASPPFEAQETGHRTVSLLPCSYDPTKIMNGSHNCTGLSCHKPVFKHTYTLNHKHSHILPWLAATLFWQRHGRTISHLMIYRRISAQLQFLLQTSHVTLGNSFTPSELHFSVCETEHNIPH